MKKNICKANALILAGGFGRRLKNKTKNIPKCMVEIKNNKPIILHQILQLKKNGFKKICILLHHQNEKVTSFLKNGSQFGVKITYCIEENPRGTGGAVYDARKNLKNNFLVVLGDTYFDINLKKFYYFHKKSKSKILIFSHPNNHPHDSDLLITDKNNNVVDIKRYKKNDNKIPNLVCAGLFCMNKTVFNINSFKKGKIDLTKNVIKTAIKNRHLIKSYKSVEYIKDMGTPDRLKSVKEDILSKKIFFLSEKTKRRAVFFDRDGTIIKERGYINNVNKVEFFNGVERSLKILNNEGFLSIMVTNQPIIARGEMSEDKLFEIHNFIEKKFGHKGAYIDEIYFCPHHPHSGFKGEIKRLKIKCECRKPKNGLILNAIKKFNIDVKKSWLIGDATSDILAAKKSNLKSILVKTGYAGKDKKYKVKPNFITSNFNSAVRLILG